MKPWGRIDVLVHNAGNAMLGISEEIGSAVPSPRVEGYQTQFATNFWGPLNITHAVLPYMRAARSGTVVFVGSRSSWKSDVLMLGPYASSKAALSAAAEALAVEVAPFGIRVIDIWPGSMRTRNFENLILLPTTKKTRFSTGSEYGNKPGLFDTGEGVHIEDYTPYRSAQIDFLRTLNGIQPGDPARAAKMVVDVVRKEGAFEGVPSGSGDQEDVGTRMLPNLLVLGSDAQRDVRNKCTRVMQGIDDWEEDIAKRLLDSKLISGRE